MCDINTVASTSSVSLVDDDVTSDSLGSSKPSIIDDECVHLPRNPTQAANVCSQEPWSEQATVDHGDEFPSKPVVPLPDDAEVVTKSEKHPSVLRRVLRKPSTLPKFSSEDIHRRKPRRRPLKVRVLRRPRKVVVMGDMFSGKSNLISAYCRDRFSTNYVPTLLSTCLTDAKVFGENIELVVVEVVGREDYAKLRKCAYHKMDAVILCYSADNPESLRRITDYWVPELKHYAPKVPFILVATKKDIRDDVLYEGNSSSEEGVVPTASGEKVAKSIGAQSFVECSALYRDSTRDVFETAAKVALRKSRRKRKMRQNRCIVS